MLPTPRYDSGRSHDSSVVQSVERRTVNPYVTGSSPVRGAILEKPAQGNLSGLFAFGVLGFWDFGWRLGAKSGPSIAILIQCVNGRL